MQSKCGPHRQHSRCAAAWREERYIIKMAKLAASISSNTIRGAKMVYMAKRGKSRCPTHPGALLRDDIIPATGRTKAGIAGLLGISRQHLYDILQEKKPVPLEVALI
jgi:hypothetical protein